MNRHICGFAAAAVLGLLSACAPATLNLPPSEDTIRKIEAGMTEKTVRLLAGEPDRVDDLDTGDRVIYYRESIVSDCDKEPAACVPIVVADGHVAAIGHQWMDAWRKGQENAKAHRRRQTAAPPPTVKKEAPLRLNGTDGDAAPDAATRAQIERLEKQVRRIPVSRTMDNLRIYRYLHKLDPTNPRYIRKLAFYEARLASDQAQQAEKKRMAAERRHQQNEALKRFEGNDRVRMALENLGGGRFHVWIENRYTTPILVSPRHFTLVCTNGARFSVYQCKDFDTTVAPGAAVDGRMAFDAYCPPKEMIFKHAAVGRIRRVFPDAPPAPESPSKSASPDISGSSRPSE